MRKIIYTALLGLLISCSLFTYSHAQDKQVQEISPGQNAQIELDKQKADETKSTFTMGSYTPLAQLPGFSKIDEGVAAGELGTFTFASYVKTLVRIAIGLIGILAVVMIVVSGVQYMGSNMFTEKEAAKSRLWGAITGLILAISSVLILRTINPQLTNIELSLITDGKWCEENATTIEKIKTKLSNDPKLKLSPEEQSIYDRAQNSCANAVAQNIDIPEELKIEYEREDLPDNVIAPDGKSSACKGGIIKIDTVNQKNLAACADIAENYKNMIAAAKNDGLILTASGARTMEQQIALRKQNCGGSAHYNVYEKPSKECHPPTARPGKSMHQQGLAFDIGINEKTICFPNNSTTCRKSGNKGFLWLEKNAQKYGFYNLPSEGWHWSVNGK